MDRISNFYYANMAPVQESGAVVAGVIATLLSAAVAKAVIRNKTEQKRIERYKKEKAAGNVSDKTMAKVNKIKRYGMTYPEYEATVQWYESFSDQVKQILTKYQKLIQNDLKKLTSNGEFKDYPDITYYSDEGDGLSTGYDETTNPPFCEIMVCYALSYDEVAACIDDADIEHIGIGDTIKYVASAEHTEALKNMSLAQFKKYTGAVRNAIVPHIAQFGKEIAKLGIPISGYKPDNNPDDVYEYYGVSIRFEKHDPR